MSAQAEATETEVIHELNRVIQSQRALIAAKDETIEHLKKLNKIRDQIIEDCKKQITFMHENPGK